ncbi:MAG: hypothetical protein IJR87_03900 [Bacteroidaceae bacterium]|nr:hypothetical protein [Bacteroidaceae bacterium]
MKKNFYLLLSLLVLISSCSKDDDDEAVPSDICYISGVTLGVVKRVVQTTLTNGRDTLIASSYNAGLFPMTINQREMTIENRDSLLYGTRLSALLMTVNYKGSVVAYRDADADTTEEWTKYSASDSLNLTKPIHLYVLSEDGHSKRVYTLKVNVHQQEGDSLSWTRVDSIGPFGMSKDKVMSFQPVAMRSVIVDGKLVVLAKNKENAIVTATRSDNTAEGKWTFSNPDLPLTADVESLRQQGNALFVGTSDGAIYTSSDAQQWTELVSAQAGLKLAAVTEKWLYALTADGLYRTSRTEPGQWQAEMLDDDAGRLPALSLNSRYFVHENGYRYLQLVGACEGVADSTAVVWSKVWDDDEDETTAEWVYFSPSPDNKYLCPALQHLSVFSYDGRGVALGGASIEGRGSHKPLDMMLVTNDQGVTWKADGSLHLPTGLKADDGPVTAIADEDHFIWIVTQQEVWRGRLNRLGFARQ